MICGIVHHQKVDINATDDGGVCFYFIGHIFKVLLQREIFGLLKSCWMSQGLILIMLIK